MNGSHGIPTGLAGRAGATLAIAALVLAIAAAACSGGGTDSSPSGAASQSPAASPSPAASSSPAASPSPAASSSPSAAALPSCLAKATYDKLNGATKESLAANASAIIAGLRDWAPPAAFDARYRDDVVAKLEAGDYAAALLAIGMGLTSGQWDVKVC